MLSVLLSFAPPTSAFAASTSTVQSSVARAAGDFHWGDWDGDGLNDALVVSSDGHVRLLRNRRDGTFDDATEASGLAGLDAVRTAAWGDYDADGRLDVYIGSASPSAGVFRNAGQGRFERSDLDVKHAGTDLLARWHDYDGDGLPDLHVHTDLGDVLYHNHGSTLFERVELPIPSGKMPLADGARHPDLPEGDVPAGTDAEPTDSAGSAGGLDTNGGRRRSRRPSASGSTGSGGSSAPPPAGGTHVTPTGSHNGGAVTSCAGAPSVQDSATMGCILASSTPTLGLLYPLGANLNVDSSGRVGMGTTTPAHKLHVIESAATSIFGQGGITGVRGEANLAGTGNRYGGYFTSSGGSNNIGVYGVSTIGVFGTGTGYGVYGETNTGASNGVYGKANHSSAAVSGVLGETLSSNANGIGVKGLGMRGVLGETSADTGFGVEGRNTSGSGAAAVGVYGSSSSLSGIGVKGQTGAAFGRGVYGLNTYVPLLGSSGPVGVHGEVAAATGKGVFGVNTATSGSGTPYGVYGEAAHVNGVGVQGWSTATTGSSAGVVGISSATSGSGVFGQGGSFTGVNYGVHGQSNSSDGYAVYAEGRLRVDGNAAIGATGVPSHRLTVHSPDTETMRLLSDGAFGSGARFNFGDADYVYFEEDSDDHLRLFSSRGARFDCNPGFTALDVANNGGSGNATPTILATNDSTNQGIAIKAVSKGTDGTVVLTQQGTGSLIRAFRTGSTPVFEVTNTGRCVTTALQITGGGDLVEGFDADPECTPGSVVVIDARRPGQLTLSSEAYDRKVAGVVSGAGGIEHGIHMGQDGVLDGSTLVAMTGRVYVRCTTENGAIAPGDRLTSASTAGCAMLATDRERCDGAVIGKAMSALDEGTGLVLVLVNLQ